ncbi:MAG: glycoside hydrolase family 31 protein [Fusobacteriota bacterium]
MHCGEILVENGNKEEKKYYKNLGEMISYKTEKDSVLFKGRFGNLNIKILEEDIIRVTMLNKKEQDLRSTKAVIYEKSEDVNINLKDAKDTINIVFKNIKIEVSKKDISLKFYKNGKLITEDHSPYSWNKDQIGFSHIMEKEDKIYGLGEKTGFLDKRGRIYEMWNSDVFDPHNTTIDPLYVSIPFFVNFNQKRTYGIYFDNSYRSHFDMGANLEEAYNIWAEGGKVDYYMILGKDVKEVIGNYTKITGKPALPPKWSLGHHQSRYTYKSDKEVTDILDNFIDRDIPCDAIHLDIHYMDEYRVFTWDENNYPFPKKMAKKIQDSGKKLVNIVDPGVKIDSNYKVYRDMMKNDYYCKYINGEEFIGKVWPGETVFPDFTKKDVRKWWGDLTTDFMEEYGVEGIWHDMNEPAVFNDTSTMDTQVYHHGDGDGGTHLRYHNMYGFFENQAVFESIKENQKKRPFILTRAGFSGIQRYAAIWTGDNRSMWEHLELAVPMMLNMGISGLPFVGTDVGGFSFDTNGELLTRWYQLGAFSPFFRNHCEVHSINQEPWSFGKEKEEIITKYIRLRYSLMNELYNQFYKSHKTGVPVIKPIFMEYPEDKDTYDIYDQFIFGESILVAPIIRPGIEIRKVYLPEGKWYDYHTGEEYIGGDWILYKASLEKLPMFVKGGSIIAFNEVFQSVEKMDRELLKFRITLDGVTENGKYLNYNDDGESFDFENGEYNLEDIRYKVKEDLLEIEIKNLNRCDEYKYKKYEFDVRNAGDIKKVKVNGEDVDFKKGDQNIKISSKN